MVLQKGAANLLYMRLNLTEENFVFVTHGNII